MKRYLPILALLLCWGCHRAEPVSPAVREVLVGYERGHSETAKRLAGEFGATVLDDYRPGGYLVIAVPERDCEETIDRLRRSNGIRFAEANGNQSAQQEAPLQ